MLSNVLDWVYDNHEHRLTSWNQPVLSSRCLEQYVQAIRRKGSPLYHCFGFVDGTVKPISRPEENQRVVYNGHKRIHSLKFQAIAISNGLIANMYDSNLLPALQRHAIDTAGKPLCKYGDLAYPLRPQLMCPYRQGDYPVFTENMRLFNTAMSEVRV